MPLEAKLSHVGRPLGRQRTKRAGALLIVELSLITELSRFADRQRRVSKVIRPERIACLAGQIALQRANKEPT